MNKFFKVIRDGDYNTAEEMIKKNPNIVNEIYTASKPKKDIGQSPLQVAIKCGEFKIIDLLIENGADINFFDETNGVNGRNPLNDSIIFTFSALAYGDYESSANFIKLIKKLLDMGVDPNKQMASKLYPIGIAINDAENLLYASSSDKKEIIKKSLFNILDLLIENGADVDIWLDQRFFGDTNRNYYFNSEYEFNVSSKIEIRKYLKEYFDMKKINYSTK